MKVRIEGIARAVLEKHNGFTRIHHGTFDCPDTMYGSLHVGERIWFGVDGDGGRTRYNVMWSRSAALNEYDELGLVVDVATDDVADEIRSHLTSGTGQGTERDRYVQWCINHSVWP